MPKVTVPGVGVVSFPDTMSQEEIIAAIQKDILPRAKEFAPPETTVGGQVKEFFKGIPAGAVNLLETAGVGASALLPEDYEKSAREAIQSGAAALKKPFAAAPGYEEAVGRKFGEAVGSTGPFFATGPLGMAGRVAATGLAGSAGAGEARLRAEQEGATEGQRAGATALGTAVGFTEMLPVFKFIEALGTPFKKDAITMIRRAAATGGAEGAQEAAAQIAQNLIAKGIYKPEQAIIEGAGEEGAYGAGTGALIQALTDMALGRRAKGAPTPGQEAPVGVPATAKQQDMFGESTEGFRLPPEPYRAAEEQEGERQNRLFQITELRDQHDVLMREVDRLKGAFENPAATSEQKQQILARAEQLNNAREEVAAEIKALGKGLEGIERAGAVETPEQRGLDFDMPAMPRQRTGEGVVLGEEAAAPAGMTPEQEEMFRQERINAIRARMDAGEMITPADRAFLNLQEREQQAAFEAQPTPEITMPEERDVFRLGPQYIQPAPTLEEAVETRPITEADFQAMGIGRTNKKIREAVLGKDLTDPVQREEVREVLTDYANDPNRSAKIVSGVENFLSSGPFMEQAELDFSKPKRTRRKKAEEVVDDRQPAEPVGSAVEPSIGVAEQRGEVPAAGVETLEPSGVGVPAADVGVPDARAGVQPAALEEPAADVIDLTQPRAARTALDQEGQALLAEYKELVQQGRVTLEDANDLNRRIAGAGDKQRAAWEIFQAIKAARNRPARDIDVAALQTSQVGTAANDLAPTSKERVPLDNAVSRLMFEGNLKRSEATQLARDLADAYDEVSAQDVTDAVQRVKGGKPLYREGSPGKKGVAAARVQKLVDGIVSRWKNAPKIQVVQSANELPDYLQQQMAADNVTPPGAFDPDSETIYLIADNTTSDVDAALTLAHEALGHYGLRSILGGSYTKMMNDIYNGNRAVREQADIKIKQGLDKETAVEEVLAEMAEKGVYNNTMQRIFNAIRQFFRRIGVDFRRVTDAEVRELLANAQRFVVAGGPKAEGTAAFKGKPLYRDLTPEGQRAAELNERMKGIANPRPAVDDVAKGLLGKLKIFERGENDPGLVTQLRRQVVDKDASVNEKLQATFDNKLVDALGNIRADLLVDQAQEHAAITSEVLMRGGVRVAEDGLVEVYDSPDNMQNVFDLITNKLGNKLGSADLAMNLAHNAGIARRADALNKFNEDQEAKAVAAEKKGNKAAAQKLRDMKVTVRASQAEIDAGLEALNTYPEIREALEMFDRFNSGLIDFLVKTGRINEMTAENWKQNTGYVPWTRVEEEVNAFEETPVRGKVSIVSLSKLPILDKQGSDKEISNIFDNMMGHTGWVVRTGLMARAANQMAEQLPDTKELKSDQELQTELKKNRNRIVFTYKDGERTPYLLGSVADMAAFAIAPDIQLGVLKPFKTFADILRNFVTHMPAFALGQLIQDGTYRGMLLSGVQNPFSIPPKVFRNFYEILTGKEGTAAKIASLGITGVYDGMPDAVIKRAREQFGLEEVGKARKAWGALEKFSLAADLAVRSAIYEQTMQETGGDRTMALYRAKEYINFKRAGMNPAVRGLRHLVPFMNAYIQGMDVLYRTMTGKGVAQGEKRKAMQLFWATGAKLAALNVLYTMLVSDDDEYKGLEDYERAKNYIIPGTGVKIPVAPEVGFLFKVIPELTTNYILREGTEREMDATTVRKAFTDAFANAYGGVNLTPQLVKPALEVAVNYSFFTGNPIVGQSMKNVDPGLQFNSGTSELAKFIGGVANISPMKLDYLIRGYTGMLGALGLQVTDAVANPDKMDKPIYKLPQVSTFMYDPTGRGYKSEFYNFREEVDKVVDTVNLFKREGRAEELSKYLDDDKLRLYAMRGVVNKVEETLSGLRKYRNIIANDPDLSSAEKRQITDEVLAQEKEILLAYNVPQLRKMTKE